MSQQNNSDEIIPTKLACASPEIRKVFSTRISEDECTEKIDKASRQISTNLENIKTYQNDLEAYNSKDFYNRLRIISNQYFILSKHVVNLTNVEMLRKSNAATIIRLNGIEIFVDFLDTFIGNILRQNPSQDVEYTVFRSIQKLMLLLMNYSDASDEFGVKLCENDRFLRLYKRILETFIPSSIKENLSDNHSKILQYALSNIYNLLLFENEANIAKILEWKFLELVQPLLHCNNDRLKLSAIFLTIYLINEEDAAIFKTDQSAIKYLLTLLKKSLNTRNKRSTGFSSLELAKAVNKLAKNDDTKTILVDLEILPIIKQMMDQKSSSLQLKDAGISILWDLAFNEHNREIISQCMLTDLQSMNEILQTESAKPLITTAIEDDEVVESETRGRVLDDEERKPVENERDETNEYGNILLGDMTKKSGKSPATAPPRPLRAPSVNRKTSDTELSSKNDGETVMDDTLIDSDENEVKMTQIEEKHMRMTCRKTLDGLMWTLKESKRKSKETKNLTHFSTASLATSDSEAIKENHVMLSYCWSNEEIVMKIYNNLKAKGYTVWIDKFNMSESENIMEAMANAVENSYAVIICISKNYKDSKNCRAEANYAYQKNKCLIPIMVQPKYRPDGWLGITISGLQYIDFMGRFDFETAQQKLIYKLNQNLQEKVDEVDRMEIIKKKTETSAPVYSTWSSTEVKEWLGSINLSKYEWPSNYDGAELQFLKTLQTRTTESFIQLCKSELLIDNLKDLRIFYQSLKNL